MRNVNGSDCAYEERSGTLQLCAAIHRIYDRFCSLCHAGAASELVRVLIWAARSTTWGRKDEDIADFAWFAPFDDLNTVMFRYHFMLGRTGSSCTP